jgi:hypothetical protein
VREIVRSTQFKRDVKLAKKSGKDLAKLRDLILLLAEGTPPLPRHSHRVGLASPIQSGGTTICTWFAPEPTLICFDSSCPPA